VGLHRVSNRPEQQIQHAVFEHLALRGASTVFAFHPANGGWRSGVEAAILKGMGVKAGVPDIIAIKNARCYALELKGAGAACGAIVQGDGRLLLPSLHRKSALRKPAPEQEGASLFAGLPTAAKARRFASGARSGAGTAVRHEAKDL
jgi:hypothetical protein